LNEESSSYTLHTVLCLWLNLAAPSSPVTDSTAACATTTKWLRAS